MTDTILDRIKSYKLEEIIADKAIKPLDVIENEARDSGHVRPFAKSLQSASISGYGLIAEIKKASPSKGLIRADFIPAAIAKSYEAGGAACLSVLTDSPSFQGAKEFLVAARTACNLPVLRKDFMYDPYQIIEARALGADCILIIMASVSDQQAAELEDTAIDWGMDVLIEVHDIHELERAISLKSPLIGINNRNLKTFETNLNTTRKLSKLVPSDRIIVSESGLNTPKDLADMTKYGVRTFLMGESLMRQADVTCATQTILKDPIQQSKGI
ncbi:MAG: indole-3-glycerol phosphate synthase TrpC [Alphaproteobacteria bacterium]|jgi:indole-3-glycerol phosphate synthase|nr:indole-3-glycerol phosphate synthase TrpC [Alphaproteobacteria bacterium]